MANNPTTIIIFGITGDLAQKKLLPAMYDLYKTGRFVNTKIVGFSRRQFSSEEIHDFVKKTIISKNFDDSFLDLVTYVSGQFNDRASYVKLEEHLNNICDKDFGNCSNKLFYLSVPPNLYEMISTNISATGLSIPCGGEDGFARILLEKPFGKNLKTAQDLDLLLGKLFHESQIYRIDHYMAKESLFNIINVYRKNPDLAKKWNSDQIEKVEIDLFEKDVVGSRGVFYDGVGALCDVGQNHMLQILALITMDLPQNFESKMIQDARAKILESIIPHTQEDLDTMKRGQYQGYLLEQGVAENSTTETFFSLSVKVSDGCLKSVPIVLKSGKGLSKKLTQINIYFKNGEKLIIQESLEDGMSAYQKVFLDCILGDQTVFISTREIIAQWSFITPIVMKMGGKKPFIYEVGSIPDSL